MLSTKSGSAPRTELGAAQSSLLGPADQCFWINEQDRAFTLKSSFDVVHM